MAVAAVSTAQ